jgi:hypothetical protein
MEPDHFCSQVYTFQARFWRTFPCLFLLQYLPLPGHDSTSLSRLS